MPIKRDIEIDGVIRKVLGLPDLGPIRVLLVTRAGTVGRGHNFPAKPPATPGRIEAVLRLQGEVQVLLSADTTLTIVLTTFPAFVRMTHVVKSYE